jgi:hypothetical protein
MREFRISLAEALTRIARLRQDFLFGRKVTEADWPAVMEDTEALVGLLTGLMILRGSLDLVHMQLVYMDQLNGYAEIADEIANLTGIVRTGGKRTLTPLRKLVETLYLDLRALGRKVAETYC